jgi:hypothetical protein
VFYFYEEYKTELKLKHAHHVDRERNVTMLLTKAKYTILLKDKNSRYFKSIQCERSNRIGEDMKIYDRYYNR